MSSIVSRESIDSQSILDLLPMGAIILDRPLRVRAWNATLVEWTGVRREAILEKSLSEVFPRLKDWCFRDRLAQVFELGTPAIFSAALHKYFLPVETRSGPYRGNMLQQTVVRPIDVDRTTALVLIQDVTAQFIQMEELRVQRREWPALR